MSKVLPFTYHGSKYTSFEFINSKLPRTKQYVEPFGGAGTVLLNRTPVPVETYNDLLGDIPHLFRVLRDCPDELIEQLRKTPYSRGEYRHAIEQRQNGYPDCDDLERARLFFVTLQQARSHRQHSNPSSWSYMVSVTDYNACDNTTGTWKARVDETLEDVAGRLRDVQFEERPAMDVIDTHDRESATFYVDPPYVAKTRGSDGDYAYELTADGHEELFERLDACDGFVAVSGYDSDLYESLYDGWYRYNGREKSAHGSSANGTRQEVLWTNYDADELGGQKIGDWPEPQRKGKQLTLS